MGEVEFGLVLVVLYGEDVIGTGRLLLTAAAAAAACKSAGSSSCRSPAACLQGAAAVAASVASARLVLAGTCAQLEFSGGGEFVWGAVLQTSKQQSAARQQQRQQKQQQQSGSSTYHDQIWLAGSTYYWGKQIADTQILLTVVTDVTCHMTSDMQQLWCPRYHHGMHHWSVVVPESCHH